MEAYFQSAKLLIRDVFIRNPAKKLELKLHKLHHLLKLLYELFESGEMWYETLYYNLRDDLEMSLLMSDLAFYVKRGKNWLNGINGNYVYEII